MNVGNVNLRGRTADMGAQTAYFESRRKRLLDMLIAMPAIVVCALLLPFVDAMIQASSRGPLFYSEERVGLRGRRFRIWKFRTMHPGYPYLHGRADEPGVFAFGRLLRRTHLDELPQAWNVLVGDMSIVGPRPWRPEHHAEYAAQYDWWTYRLNAVPGITGLAQIRPCAEVARHDREYVDTASLRGDLTILALTVWKGIRALLIRPRTEVPYGQRQQAQE